MTVARQVLGIVAMVVALGPLLYGADCLRRRWLHGWHGAAAGVGSASAAVAVFVIITEVLGTVGLLSLWPLTIACVVVGALLSRVVPLEHGPAAPAVSPPTRVSALTIPLAMVSAILVFAEWGSRTAAAFTSGMTTVDTVWYHLPLAARFAQTGSIAPLHHLEPQAMTTFFPANSALFHAGGVVFLGNDLGSVVSNLAWLGFALAAAWAAGRPFGVAPLALTGVATVLLMPASLGTQPGGAYNDVVGIAMLLASFAIVATAASGDRSIERGELLLASMAAGVAVGTKFQFLAPSALLTFAVLPLIVRGGRLRGFGWWMLGLASTGAYWYVRNLVVARSPLPAVEISIGGLELPSTPPKSESSALLEYLFKGENWTTTFLPGLRDAFGFAWWALLAFVAIGCLAALFRGRVIRSFAMVAGVSLLAFAFTPAFYGEGGFGFVYILRYPLPALSLGVVVGALAASQSRRTVLMASATFGFVLVVLAVERSGWPEPREFELESRVWSADSVVAIAAVIGLFAVLAGIVVLWRRSPSTAVPVVGLLIIGAVVASVAVQQHYLDNRYREDDLYAETFTWASGQQDQRIGLSGTPVQYPLYGDDLSNHVQVLGQEFDRGNYRRIAECRPFLRMLNTDRYDFVVSTPHAYPFFRNAPEEQSWLDADPAAHVVLREGPVTVYELIDALDVDGCS